MLLIVLLQMSGKALRPTSPVHVHVDDDIPVHVHVKQPKKKKSGQVSKKTLCKNECVCFIIFVHTLQLIKASLLMSPNLLAYRRSLSLCAGSCFLMMIHV